jgi:hypothetical protein
VSKPTFKIIGYRHANRDDPDRARAHRSSSSAPASAGSPGDAIIPWPSGRRRRSTRRVPPVSRSRTPSRRDRFGDRLTRRHRSSLACALPQQERLIAHRPPLDPQRCLVR